MRWEVEVQDVGRPTKARDGARTLVRRTGALVPKRTVVGGAPAVRLVVVSDPGGLDLEARAARRCHTARRALLRCRLVSRALDLSAVKPRPRRRVVRIPVAALTYACLVSHH